jgi:sulfite reductase (NADPH) flavoprotein alpha-component
MLRKLWFQLHWLFGITAGTVLALVGITGAILSFEGPIEDWLNREVRRVEARPQPLLSPAELAERVRAAQPERALFAVQVFSDPSAAARITLAPPRAAESERRADGERALRGEQGAGQSESAGQGERAPRGGDAAARRAAAARRRGEVRYADPYTGELIGGAGNRGESFFRLVTQTHRFLLMSELGYQFAGRQVTGACALICLFLAISGIYLRWPRKIGNWRAWLAIDWRRKGRPFLWSLHAATGTWVLVVYLVIAGTGPQWSYDWYRRGLFALAGVPLPVREADAEGGAGAGRRGAGRGAEGEGASAESTVDLAAAWTTFLEQTRETGYRGALFTLPRRPGRPIEVRYLDAQPAHERATSMLRLDAATGRVLESDRYADRSLGGKLVSSIFALHSGSFFGLGGKLVFMAAALCMPLFAVSGWLMYLERRSRARRSLERRARSGRVAVPALEPAAAAMEGAIASAGLLAEASALSAPAARATRAGSAG